MIEIIFTKDGSQTLRNIELQETYHSIHGAVQESIHVFIKNGLSFKLESNPKEISLLEVGLGTGLNALLSVRQVEGTSCNLSYTSLEPFPLDESIWSELNYASGPVEQAVFQKIHQAEWNRSVSITPAFELFKVHQTIQQSILPIATFDIVYFDAFAPEKQSEMWTLDVLQKVAASMKPGGVFVTYCAKGQVKRNLKNLGLHIETLPGPPGKREMIRAIKY